MPEYLKDHTTLRVGGPALEFVVARTEADLIAAVREADQQGMPVLVLGGGSNLVVGDEGFDGRVVQVDTRGLRVDDDSCDDSGRCGGVLVHAAAGEPWDEFVARTVASGWAGVEALSGIPGRVGATPIQNVGAYGQEVAQTIARVRTWDRREGAQVTFLADDCAFSYRNSRFKTEHDRFLVLEVSFQFRQGELSEPVRYAELAGRLGVDVGTRAPASQVRDTVLAIRRGKGMVLDAEDHDTWSAGSFFTNPVLTPDRAEQLPPDAPRFAAPGGMVKTSAGWLIDHAGFHKGYGSGAARLSSKHVLALTNTGAATAADVLALAAEVVAGVERAYGVTLVPEPTFVGAMLPER